MVLNGKKNKNKNRFQLKYLHSCQAFIQPAYFGRHGMRIAFSQEFYVNSERCMCDSPVKVLKNSLTLLMMRRAVGWSVGLWNPYMSCMLSGNTKKGSEINVVILLLLLFTYCLFVVYCLLTSVNVWNGYKGKTFSTMNGWMDGSAKQMCLVAQLGILLVKQPLY